MPKEDYLIKYLEKLGRAIAAIISSRRNGSPDDGIRLADEIYKELWNLDTESIAAMPDKEFIQLIRNENYTASYLESIAQLTHETGRVFSAKEDIGTAMNLYNKALQLYYLLNEKDRTFSFERENIITELESIIN